MTDTESAVFVEPDEVFAAAADVRRAFAALTSPELAAPSTNHAALDSALDAIAEVANGLIEQVGPSVEAIARALTVGAIDTVRADGGD